MSKQGGFSGFFFGTVLPKIYSFGASIVILGAMFKILHLSGANYMLMLGLTVEAIIFFLGAFEPTDKEVDWSRVYPELSPHYKGPRGGAGPRRPQQGDAVSQRLDKTLEGARVGPELVESLGRGMRTLAESANRLGTVANAAAATNEYAQNVKQASLSLVEMRKSYAATASAMGQMAQASKDSQEYHTQIQHVTKNLSALNAVYEMELKDANTHLKSMTKFYSNVSAAMDSIAQAGKNSEQFREELSHLTANIGHLNKIYGSMLTAMKQ